LALRKRTHLAISVRCRPSCDQRASRPVALRAFGQPRPIRVPVADVDVQALTRAFQNGVSLSDCARLFNCSRKDIKALLIEHDISLQTRAAPPSDVIPPDVKTEDRTPTARLEPGPVEATIRKLGVADPGLLVQAAAIDRAASGLVCEAGRRTPRNAAQLAAQDKPTADTGRPAKNGQTVPRRSGQKTPRRAPAR